MPHMELVNLGCGTKAAPGDRVLNIDWTIYLRIRRSRVLSMLSKPLLSAERRRHLESLPENVQVHDLSRGIPLPDASCKAVYSSHLLEHIDHDIVGSFMKEVHRVLMPGGINRIVVPDLERLGSVYLSSLAAARQDASRAIEHEQAIHDLLEQSVRKMPYGASQQRPVVRWLDTRLLGDARKRGETHQWMYDEISLGRLLTDNGFVNVSRRQFDDSDIADWPSYGLETEGGVEYKPGSLYIECRKP